MTIKKTAKTNNVKTKKDIAKTATPASKSAKVLVSKVAHPKTANLKNTIASAVNRIGGFASFIKKGDEVILKPNFNTDDEFPGSSDPAFVVAVIELLFTAGAKKVTLAESSWLMGNTEKFMQNTNMIALARKAGADVTILDNDTWIEKKVVGAHMQTFHLAKTYADACTKRETTKNCRIIYLPCMKTHYLARFTLALKLPMGLIRKDDRIKMHMHHLEKKIADMNLLLKPDLIIMDGRKCFITGGPKTGDTREPNIIMASTDQVAIDVEAIKIIQSFPGNNIANTNPWQFDQIVWSVKNKIGVASEKEYRVIEK